MTVVLGWEPESSTRKKTPSAMQSEPDNELSSTHTPPQVKSEERTPSPIPLLPEAAENSDPEVQPSYGWKHPAELQYITPEDWTPTKIILYLIANAFSVPPRAPKGNTPFFIVTGINGDTTRLPIGYRVPLLYLARFQWDSLQLVLNASSRESEWSEYKFSILHVSRLCSALLNAAQEYVRVSNDEGVSKGMDRKWRCPTFDRALARYRLRWFISTPSKVEEFWDTFQEEEYLKDAVKFDWRRWALKGHRGFVLTDEEIKNGITAEQFLSGLKQRNDQWLWETEEDVIPNGIDAWSLKTLALSSSTPMKELPSTYSHSSATSEARPTPSHHESSNITKPSTSNMISSSSKNDENVLNSVSNTKGPTDDSRSSHTSDVPLDERDIPVPASSAVSITKSTHQNSNARKRPGSPLEKPLQNSPRQKTKNDIPTLVNRKQGKATPTPQKKAPSSVPAGSSSMQDSSHVSDSPMGAALNQPAKQLLPNGDSIMSPVNNSFPASPSGSSISQQQKSYIPTPIPTPIARTFSYPSSYPFLPYSTVHPHPPTSHPSPPSDNLSPEAIIQVIDSIFSGFADSLSRFSDEIRQAKAESVAEIRESLISTFLNKSVVGKVQHPGLEDMVRDTVRAEIRKAIQEELDLTSLKKEIVDSTKQDVRDGVRILVATIREEVVGTLDEVGARMEQVVEQTNTIAQQVADLHCRTVPSFEGSTAHENRGTSRNVSSTSDAESVGFVQRIDHPLQHLLGEPEDTDSNSCEDDGHEEGEEPVSMRRRRRSGKVWRRDNASGKTNPVTF